MWGAWEGYAPGLLGQEVRREGRHKIWRPTLGPENANKQEETHKQHSYVIVPKLCQTVLRLSRRFLEISGNFVYASFFPQDKDNTRTILTPPFPEKIPKSCLC